MNILSDVRLTPVCAQVWRGGDCHPGGEGEVRRDQGEAPRPAGVPAHQLQILFPFRTTRGCSQVNTVSPWTGKPDYVDIMTITASYTQVLMKDISTPVPPNEVRAVIKKSLENAALVNYERLSEEARIEGTCAYCPL